MKRYKGFKMVEAEDLEAVLKWAQGLTPEDRSNKENVERVNLIRDVAVTGLSYAIIVAKEIGGLPCFEEGQTPEQRRAAMAAAAELARKPGQKPSGKRGRK